MKKRHIGDDRRDWSTRGGEYESKSSSDIERIFLRSPFSSARNLVAWKDSTTAASTKRRTRDDFNQ